MSEGNVSQCLLRELAAAMAEDAAVKAIHLDAKQRKVAFAFAPGVVDAEIEARLRDIVATHEPSADDCAPDKGGWRTVCSVCEAAGDGRDVSGLPAGIVLRKGKGGIVTLEKASCPTGPLFWRWKDANWPKLSARATHTHSEEHDPDEWKQALALAGVCGVFAVIAIVLEKWIPGTPAWLPMACYAIAYVTGAWHPAEEVFELLRKRILDVHFLMLAVAAGAAFIGHWWEGALLLFLFSLSGALEHLALARTRKEIQSLFKEAPKEATILENGEERRVPVESLSAGMRLLVRPGDQFPVDAEVMAGSSAADESTLTGESAMVDKKVGDKVFGGTLNGWGSLELEVLRPSSESALSRIIRLIQEAQESKAPAQRLTDKFGTPYTYGILGLSTLMFFVWWLVFGVPAFATTEAFGNSAFYRAMTLLVVASPCALVLSIPSAILAGIAAGAKRGVLFRGGAAIENLAEVTHVALDKTGTLTTGEMSVERVDIYQGDDKDALLRIAAALSHHSAHPVSRAIVNSWRKSAGEKAVFAEITDFRSVSGYGLEGRFQGQFVRLGRRSYFEGETWVQSTPESAIGETETFISVGDQLRGRIITRDTVRSSGQYLLDKLHAAGLTVTMLTGDKKEAAALVAEQVGLRDFRAELHPEDKVAAIREWSAKGEKVAMVGDGVNDAPSLAAAHVAVGMGLRGSGAVLEQADVILTRDRLEKFYLAYDLSRKARRIIHQNLAVSLGVIAILVLSALGSFVPLPIGVLGHEGSTVIVVLNSLRLLFYKSEI